jgi:hypothetical protein
MGAIKIYTPEIQVCVVCGRFLCRKYTTQPRTVVGLHETITASEQVMKCNNKNCSNRGNPIRSAELQSNVISHMTYGIDIVAHAGELRFYDHLTLDEIIEKFSKLGFKFGLGEMSFIINKFLALLAGVQEEKIPEIRKKFEKKGFVLSIDGTISIKGKTLYIFRDIVSSTILYSEICELNDTKQMESLFRSILEKFGTPLAIISDMQQSIIEAVKLVFPGVAHQFCQSHFLRNSGDALTKELHQELGKELKKSGVQTEVKSIQREMNKKKRRESKVNI